MNERDSRTAKGKTSTVRHGLRVWPCLAMLVVISACTGVRPEERAVLADPKMRFQGQTRAAARLEHALENREGSYGGGSVRGGGCGCN